MTEPTFTSKYSLALEASPQTAPTSGTWFQGGRWFDVVMDSPIALQGKQVIYFPEGNTTERFFNAVSPVTVKQWSAGTLAGNFEIGLGTILLAAALNASINTYEVLSDPDSVLLLNEPINANPKSIVLAKQPSNGGALLRFELGAIDSGGTIAVSGIDSYGQGASEVISFSSAGNWYSRNSFSSIGNSGIKFTGVSTACATIIGVQTYQYGLSAASTPLTFSLEHYGRQDRANPTTTAFMYPGLIVKSLTLETDSVGIDSLLRISADIEGLYPSSCANLAINNGASTLLMWPGWTMAASTNDTGYPQVRHSVITINSGDVLSATTPDSVAPQTVVQGPIQITGELDVYAPGAAPRTVWEGRNSTKVELFWNSPWKFHGSSNMDMRMTLENAYTENYEVKEVDGGFIATRSFRAILDGNNKFNMTLSTPFPGTAIGGASPVSYILNDGFA